MSAGRWIRTLHQNRWVSLLQAWGLVAVTVAVVAVQASPAEAYQAPSANWSAPATGGTDTTNATFPGGIQATITTTGLTDLSPTTTLGARGFNASDFTPTTMATGDTSALIEVNTGTCASTGPCNNLGTVTYSFSQPVRNPVIHMAGIGGWATRTAFGNLVAQSDLHAIFTLATTGVTISKLDGGPSFDVAGGAITTNPASVSANCTTTANPPPTASAAGTAGCGSVQVTGTVTSVSFNVSALFTRNSNALPATNSATTGDGVATTVTLPEDFSDAPATYNPGQAPVHIVSDLTLGSTVDEDNANVRAAAASPSAGAGATGDGADEDAFGTLPGMTTQAGLTYSLTVPVAGVSKAARLCGYLDFNQNGAFDGATEQACGNAAIGATSVLLSWTTPAGLTAGTTYARFRLGYTAAQVQSPTGRADSGEVEDYTVVIANRPQLVLRKTTAGVAGGPFGFTLTNTTQTTGTVTTTAAGTPAQVDGDTGTAGTQNYTIANPNAAVTINESSLPAGWSLTGVTCTNAAGTAVGSLSGSTYTIPGSATAPGAVVTCTYTNARPAISLTKTAGAINDLDGNGPDAGDTVPYSFLVTNTGQTPLTSVGVSDPLIAGVTCPSTTLAVGASTTCTGTYTLTQADVNAGVVNNTATASGTPPTGPAVTAQSSATRPIPSTARLTLDKSHAAINDLDGNGPDAGDTVAYSFLVTNTGNVTLTAVGVTDPIVGSVTCPAGALAPGASKTCTATYTLTQANVNAGVVNNTATASGTPPTGAAVTATDTDTLPIARTASITLDKTAGSISDLDGNGSDAGDTIAYTFLVTNTGNVTLTGVSVNDPKVGTVSCPTTTLTPGQSTTCTATYALTQADVNGGSVANTATATGTPPTGLTPPTATDNTTTPVTRTSTLTLDKQTGGVTDVDGNGPDAGDTIAYTFLVTNTGNVTLNPVTVSDPKVGPVTCPAGALQPGLAVTCTKTYTLTQADVDTGSVNNVATATGTPPAGVTPPTATDNTSTPVTPGPAITLDKQAGAPTGNTAGSTITYTFVVTNAGNVTLNPVTVSDPKVGPVACPPGALVPGAQVTCTKVYTLTQADVNSGSVVNTATASGTPPTGGPVQATDSTTTPIARTSTVTLDKVAGSLTDVDGNGPDAGDTIGYTFAVQNTGNVTLANVVVSDAKVGPVSCPVTTLQPGASTTCTATYTLSQADVDSGHVANSASVTGTPPPGVTPPTATDTTDTPITRTATITLDKQPGGVTDVDGNGTDAGDTIGYSFAVVNTGNVVLTSVNVSDPKVGTVSCPVTTLQPGQTVTCTATYTLTQADIDAGHVANSASVTGTPPPGVTPPPTANDTTDTPLTRTPAVTLDKQAGTPTGNTAGDTIDYTFVVTNSGNVVLNPVVVSDPKVGPVTCPAGALVPGASVTCTKTYTMTQADVDAGSVVNTATATGTPPTGPPVEATDSTTTPITRTASLTLGKDAGTPTGAAAGDTIDYTFVVTNTGNVTLTGVAVDDPKVGAVDCPVTTLAPGESVTCTATYTLLQSDVDAGHVANSATATGTPPPGVTPPTPPTDTTDTPIPAGPVVSLDKQAGTPTGDAAGDTIDYTFVVTNAGNVTLDPVVVTDPKVGPVSCPAGPLAPGDSVTCGPVTYALTQADVDAGTVDNTATATGTDPNGTDVSDDDSTTTPLDRTASLTLGKDAGTPTGAAAGDTIDYTFVVTNTGNVTLTGVAVDDPKVGAVDCPVTTLAPGESVTCTATYTLTQSDVDAGHVANSATATGTPPPGVTPPTPPTDTTDTPIPAGPVITLDKQAGPIVDGDGNGPDAGDTIDYTFDVTNGGNVSLTGVVVDDTQVGAVTCPQATLAPGESMTCTATYSLTQGDVDAGTVVNTATATGTDPGGTDVSDDDSTTTPVPADPAIALVKQSGGVTDLDGNGPDAGDTIAYTFLVTNSGNVTLDPVTVSDPKVGAVTCPAGPLAPGASVTCTATYTVVQADVNAGNVANTATATGTDPDGTDVSDDDSVDTPIGGAASITLDKVAGTPTGNAVGDTIDYTFEVTNSGTVTLTGVAVDDPVVGAVSCPQTTLAPAEVITCTATYTLTQADVDDGQVVNSATATGTPPTGAPPTASDSTTTPIPEDPSITLDKQAGTPTGSAAGDTIDYAFEVTNTGNVTLSNVLVSDPKVGAVDCPQTTLAPAEVVTCTATYTLTQADVDAGHVVNIATASGLSPAGTPVEDDDTTDTAIPPDPSITLVKQAGTPSGSAAGDTIDYTFAVTNTGNVTLTDVVVDDPKVGTVVCPDTTLDPGEVVTCSASYTLTQADVDAGVVDNTATATGTDPNGTEVTDDDSTSTPIPADPSLSLDKQAGTPTGAAAGDTIEFAFVVTNTGNVTLDPVTVDDPTVGPVTCPAGPLAPGASVTCDPVSYVLTQADVDSGHLANTATATGTDPNGTEVTDDDSTDTPILAGPALSLDKQAGTPSGSSAGDTIEFTFVVTNTGNVTLDPVTVDDPKVGAVTCPAGPLAPGASVTCDPVTYVLTQAEVDAGTVDNTATATGTDPNGTEVTDDDTTSTPIPATPSIALDKQAGGITDVDGNGPDAGDTIAFTFLVTNTGNVTLDPVTVDDPKVGAVTCPQATLAPAEAMTCTATYTLTQTDVDAGQFANVATVTGTDPNGTDVEATDTTDTPIAPGPAITLDKVAGTPSGSAAGDTIDYTFLVTNSGNVTLSSVSVADPKVGSVACPVTTLAPGESTTCTATYTLLQADVDLGQVVNTATATGTPPSGTPPSATDSTTTDIPADPSIVLDKQSGTPSGNAAGDTIDFTFVVTNTGNVTLVNVSIDDPKVGAVTCPQNTLAPAEVITCTATYTLTQADVDSGHVANTATATGTDPSGTDVADDDTTDTPIPPGPAISLVKQAGPIVDGDGNGADAGDTIAYSFVVTNEGNVTLTGVAVDDPKVGAVDCPQATLAPGESMTCTATYSLTQGDVDTGAVDNTATATGTDPGGTDVSDDDSTTTPIPADPSLSLDKQAATPTGAAAGDTIEFTFVVTNTGNVTLDPVTVDDPTVGPVTCPAGPLAPGDSTTCGPVAYTLTQADVDSGHLANTATATGTDPNGTEVTDDDSTDTPLAPAPALSLDKQAGTPTGDAAGDTIEFTFVVTNTGNVTLDPVTVDDPTVGPVTCPAGPLAPGASVTCDPVSYVLTQADVDSGHLANTATATGTDPNGTEVTDDDSTDTPILAGPALTLDKQAGTPTGAAAGDTIDYTFEVTNTGNVTLIGVNVSDPKVGAVDCPVTTLAPGESTLCTATYTLLQADVDAGVVDNTALATGTDPNGADVSDDDSTTTPIPADPSLSLDKQAGTPTGAAAGDTIEFAFVVTNTGNVTLDPVTVDDPTVGPVTCPAGPLAPGASVTCDPVSYVLTQADVDSGHLANTATATGTDPSGTEVTDDDSTDTPILAGPALSLDKQAGTPSGSAAGDTIEFAFVVTNTGNVTLDPVTVDDPTVGPVTCPAGPLAPGASVTCDPVTYVLTQADVDSGHLANTATATGTDPSGTEVTDDDSTDTPILAGPALSLDKQAGTPSGSAAGDTIEFTFVVTNTGNVTLDPVTVDDPKVGAVTCPAGPLAPGASVTCDPVTYVLTQADVDAGTVDNTATATGTDPNGTEVTDDDSTTTPIPAAPSLSLDKQAGVPSGNAAGDTIDFTFVVTNTGNVTLDPVTVDDPKVGAVTCPAGPLAPGASVTCDPVTYVLTQADVDAGTVDNTATATGTDPNGTEVTDDDSTTTPIPATPAIDLVKSGTANGDRAGDTVDYEFLVTNTGNVTLVNVSIEDPLVGPVDCPDTTLAPGQSTTCTATYTLTQADVDAGLVHNDATVTGTDPNGTEVTAIDSVDVPLTPQPLITLDKQSGGVTDEDGNGVDVGDTIDYTFVVTNEGNVTLAGVVVDDPTVGPVSCPVDTLAPTESTTCTATYTLTQSDVDAGRVDNTATTTGNPPVGEPVTDTDTVTTPLAQTPAIQLVKRADAQGPVKVGDEINYTFTVTNIGNVTLTNLVVDDPMLGTVTCATTTLAVGESTTCTAPPYTVTAKDVRKGSIVNHAVATADGGGGAEVSDDDDVVIRTVAAKPKIDLVKKADTKGPVKAGQKVRYRFVVTNVGKVTLTNVMVTDPMVGAVTCPKRRLAPGESTTCTSKPYTVTRSDVQHGDLVNHATATGRYCPPATARSLAACTRVSDADSVRLPTQPSGGLPNTGSPVSPVMIWISVSLLVIGGGLVLVGRRRRA